MPEGKRLQIGEYVFYKTAYTILNFLKVGKGILSSCSPEMAEVLHCFLFCLFLGAGGGLISLKKYDRRSMILPGTAELTDHFPTSLTCI